MTSPELLIVLAVVVAGFVAWMELRRDDYNRGLDSWSLTAECESRRHARCGHPSPVGCACRCHAVADHDAGREFARRYWAKSTDELRAEPEAGAEDRRPDAGSISR